jgi:putative membrane protein
MQNRKGTGQFLIAALVTAALGGCATSREQPPAANANTSAAAAPEMAQPIAQEAKARPGVIRAAPSPEESSEKNTSAILTQIHQANLKEIAIGKMAEGKASTSEVRAYADQLVQDHTNVDRTVVTIAQKIGAHLQDTAAAARQGRYEGATRKSVQQKLDSASGAGFDRLFLQQTSSDHERLIRKLQQEREDASDDDVEALIDKIVPILEQDQELAQILIKKERT